MTDFIAGFFIGAWIMLGFMTMPSESPYRKYKNVIEECEKSLPRDQECKVIGVPMK